MVLLLVVQESIVDVVVGGEGVDCWFGFDIYCDVCMWLVYIMSSVSRGMIQLTGNLTTYVGCYDVPMLPFLHLSYLGEGTTQFRPW